MNVKLLLPTQLLSQD